MTEATTTLTRADTHQRDIMKKVMAFIALLILSGCATIFEGKNQPITIRTTPEAASITITNRAGEKVHVGTTPSTVTLARGVGYFKSESYTVNIYKEGYLPRQITLTGTVNGWYLANILFGGIIGLVLVDPATGAMYSLAPDPIITTLDAVN